MVCDFLLFHSIFPTAEVRHPEQQRCIIIICKSENLGSGVMSCTEVFFLESFWSSQRSPTTNGFQKATWLFTWLYTVHHGTMFYHAFRFSLQFHTSSPLQSAWSFATSEAPSSWHRVHLHREKKATQTCLCMVPMPPKPPMPNKSKENLPGWVLKRFVIWIACKRSLPCANYNGFSLEESLLVVLEKVCIKNGPL